MSFMFYFLVPISCMPYVLICIDFVYYTCMLLFLLKKELGVLYFILVICKYAFVFTQERVGCFVLYSCYLQNSRAILPKFYMIHY